MLVSMMRSAAVAVETTGPSFGAGLRCNSIALLYLTNGHGPGSHGVDGSDPIKGVRHSACHLRQRLRRGQVPAGTTVRAAGFRWSRKELTHGSCQKDDTFSQNSGAQEHQTRRTEALVAARDQGERRARPQTRRVQADQREEDRDFVEALGRAQRAPQDRRLPLGAVDADVLHQPRRQDAAADAAHAAGAGKAGAEAGIREGVSPTSSGTSEGDRSADPGPITPGSNLAMTRS